MLRIGFSNKMFTLWNVETETEFTNVGGFGLPYKRTTFQFIRNLSKDEEQALKKASFLGCEDLDVDVELYGINSSANKTRENYSRKASDESFFFEFGKYKNMLISGCTDVTFVFWYFMETNNIHCREKLLKEFGFVEYKGHLVQSDFGKQLFRREAVVQEAIRDGKVFGEMVGNLSVDGIGQIKIEENVVLYLKFKDFKVYEYTGNKFAYPTKNGKGKRVKGHLVEVVLGEHKGEGVFDVVSFEVFKNQIIY